MVNNSTNINNANNHLSLLFTEHMTYDVGNPGPRMYLISVYYSAPYGVPLIGNEIIFLFLFVWFWEDTHC